MDHLLGGVKDLVACCGVLAFSRYLLLFIVIFYVLNRLVILGLTLRPRIFLVSLLGGVLGFLGLLNGLVLLVLVRACDILWQASKGKGWHVLRTGNLDGRTIHHQLVTGIRVKAELIARLALKLSLPLCLLLLSKEEFIEA